MTRPIIRYLKIVGGAAVIALLALSRQALPATTLLPNGENCFQANSPTSGGAAGIIKVLGTITPGAGYVSAGYANVPLTGGSGSGATANITVSGGVVTVVTLINPGFHYVAGDNLSAANTNLGGSGGGFSIPVSGIQGTGTGMIGLLGPITGGTLYTTGTYGGVALTGGLGSGATANITVSGGAVTSLTILNSGTQYVVGDVLSATAASIGGTGSGFSVSVSSISINTSLAGGILNMFIPNTTTPKATWQDANQITANPVPIILDANGCAIIFGTGSYRQVLQDSLGNTIWDQLTTDTSAQQNVFWAGVAGGTPNAITLVDPGFNATDGSIINFTALATNTGATTINPSSFGAITVLKDTTGGPIGLTGGEIIATNPISMVYRATDNAFHLLNQVIASASGATAPLCGASRLQIVNGTTPNSVIALTADQIVMQTNAGLTINRSNVNLANINITTGNVTSIANGMDGEPPGLNAWLDVFAIDNGAAPAGLVSLAAGNGKAPTMPSGYTYKCYMGAMRVDGSGNLFRTVQKGKATQYVVTAATNTATLPIMAVTSAANVTIFTSVATANFVPPTAPIIIPILNANGTAATNQTVNVTIAPNASYGPSGACSQVMGVSGGIISQSVVAIPCRMILETTNIFWGATFLVTAGTSASVQALGWEDAVNAN